MMVTMTEKPILEIKDLHVSYGAIKALNGVSLYIKEGEIVSVIGSNGAGKSTLMQTIMGIVPRESGEIFLKDEPLARKSYKVINQGITLTPEGRQVFAPLTVYENLMMGAFSRRDRDKLEEDLNWVFSLFPILKERQKQYAGTLSGGEQQMMAIARSLMSRPKVLLLDEPSLGLAPIIIRDIFKELKRINSEGVTILLVEQNARQALKLSNRVYVIQTGNIIMQGDSKEMLTNPEVEAAYLGTFKKKSLPCD
ncbi:MAG TPA: ABC transporter ATP-binding protein [Atribacterota bacterium]|nr:ABC transporter ATP-binding protein [Atribacterota bacterium]HOR42266.1 ABC transporter ATP-binding protein [Atribacterota bacterium]HPK87604.1 ABC transporter ATP-binding protein [Atribacterota bacterium]